MEEVSKFVQMMDEVYTVFGLQYKMALSTRPDDYMGELAQWDKAEAALTKALNASGKEWEVGGSACCQPDRPTSPQRLRSCCWISLLLVTEYIIAARTHLYAGLHSSRHLAELPSLCR